MRAKKIIIFLQTILKKIRLYFFTILNLKFIQIFYRVIYKLSPRKQNTINKNDITLSSFEPNISWLPKPKSFISKNEFNFLNKMEEIKEGDWAPKNMPLLWQYNLNYFEGLQNFQTDNDLKSHLINSWIKINKDAKSVSWDPYPTSLRLVNWVKWAWSEERIDINGFNESLIQQADYLSKNLEFHILGNHLLENCKALIFLGCYFDGQKPRKWLTKGLSILEEQLDEQILEDGGHFELSTMYHSLMFELVLDILQLSNQSNAPLELRSKRKFLTEKARKMSLWLIKLTHPDGEIAYFNDSAIGIAPNPQLLQKYWNDVSGISSKKSINEIEHLESSGYCRLQKGNCLVFFDLAQIGPDYLPGHGHADHLSIECSIDKQRIFVNLGTSEYLNSDRRRLERGTSGHSTLQIKDYDSSEVWDIFRVARRANVTNIKVSSNEKEIIASGCHDGYTFLKTAPVHKRKIKLLEGQLIINDHVSESKLKSTSRFHLHPDIRVILNEQKKSGLLILPDQKEINFSLNGEKCYLTNSLYALSFGLMKETKTINIQVKDNYASMNLFW